MPGQAIPNRLYFGDCLEIMAEYIPDESIDLIYLDPPFNSKRIYNAFIGGAQWVAFDDTGDGMKPLTTSTRWQAMFRWDQPWKGCGASWAKARSWHTCHTWRTGCANAAVF